MKKLISLFFHVSHIAFLFFLFSLPALAQPYYGKARFYRTDAWPRSGMIYDFNFQSRASEGLDESIQSMEQWGGPSGDCTECPVDFYCLCPPSGTPDNDITKETSIVLIGENSAKLMNNNSSYPGLIGIPMDFEKNSYYQTGVWYKGTVGGGQEYAALAIHDSGGTITYDFTTETWVSDCGGSFPCIVDLPTPTTSWQTLNKNVVVDGVDRNDMYVSVFWIHGLPGEMNMYIDNFYAQKVIEDSSTGTISICSGSNPLYGHNKIMMPRVGTGPSGDWGVSLLNGTDCLFCEDGDCSLDPINFNSAGSFSVGVKVSPYLVGLNALLPYDFRVLAKGSEYSMNLSNSEVDFSVSAGASTGSVATTGTNCIPNSKCNLLVTYSTPGKDNIAANTATLNLYSGDAVFTDASAYGAPTDNADTFYIGASGGDSTQISIEQITFWDKELSAVEISKYQFPHFPSGKISDGFYVTDCWQDVEYDFCSNDVCTTQNSMQCQAWGTGSLAIYDEQAETLAVNSFEAWNGSDDAPTDFFFSTITRNNGDGTARVFMNMAESFNWAYSVSTVLTGTTSNAAIDYACDTTAIAQDVYTYVKAKKLSGNPVVSLKILEYDDAACAGNLLKTTTITPSANLDESWRWIGGHKTAASWDGSTLGYIFEISFTGAPSSVLIDYMNFHSGSHYFRPPVTSLAGPTSPGAMYYKMHNPLSDYDNSNSRYAYTAGFCVSGWVYDYTTMDDLDHFIVTSPATSGSENLWYIYTYENAGNYYVEFAAFDGSATSETRYLQITSTTWTPDAWKYFEACLDNAGAMTAHHYNTNNSTWYTWSSSAGAMGAMDGQSSDLYLGTNGAGSYQLNGFISEFTISPYNAAYTYDGFNNGKAPKNGNNPAGLTLATTILSCGDGVVNLPEQCDFGAPASDNCCEIATCMFTANGSADPQSVCALATECQNDVCNGSGGCTTTNKANGTACTDDTLYCTGTETCQTGVCTSSGNPCTPPTDCDEVNNDCTPTVPGDTAWNDAILHVSMEENNPPWDGTTPTGEIAQDSTLENNDVTAYISGGGNTNITGSMSGIIGDGFYFNNSGALNAPLHAEFETTTFSVNIWATNYDQIPVQYQVIFAKDNTSIDSWLMVIGPNPDNHLSFQVKNNAGSYGTASSDLTWSGGESSPANVFHMFTGVYDGSNVILYIDGVPVDSDPLTGTPKSHPTWNVSIGNFYDCTSTLWQYEGRLDEATMWDRAITPDEVTYLYNGGTGRAYGL